MTEQQTSDEEAGTATVAPPSTTYTRTGDLGETTLGDHSRTAKTDPRIAAYGDCEEACALIGEAVTLGSGLSNEVVRLLARVQNDLVDVSADICDPVMAPDTDQPRINEEYVQRLERACDHFNAELPQPSSFVVPGGTTTAATLHHARTVVRRAERTTQGALEHDSGMSRLTQSYLNRLGSLLFILARRANVEHGDTLWEPGLSATLGNTELWEAVPEPEES
ncbi:MAG: cob(I)yrinic acid a,c-diamide adenosyltransferase [Nocardioidaceae bacterium]